MTNREHMIELLQRPEDLAAAQYFLCKFGCHQIPVEECVNHNSCNECWNHWLESEVSTNDHA